MYNYSMNIDIVSSTNPITALYQNINVKVTGDKLSDAIQSIATIFTVQPTQVKVNKVSYIQEVLKIEVEE